MSFALEEQVERSRFWHCIFCGWRCPDPDTNGESVVVASRSSFVFM